MKKKLLAAAVVGALASPVALAQTTVYGIVDVGYQNAKHAAGNVNKDFFQSGQKDRSRLGVRGSEDVAPGMYALYQIEFDIVADTGATPAAGMTHAITMVGLGSKAWGELTLGRQYTHTFHNNVLGQAARTETFASAASLMPRTVRASNSIKYSSPRFGGLTVGAIYAPSSADQTAAGGPEVEPTAAGAETNYWDVGVIWRAAAFGVGASYGRETAEAAGVETETTLTGVAAYFDNKAFGIYGAYSLGETEAGPLTTSDVTAWSISGVVYFGGRNELYAMYGQSEEDAVAGSEATFWGVALMHRLSKRTTVYVGYGQVENDGPSALRPSGFAATTAAGFDPRGFQVGLSHHF